MSGAAPRWARLNLGVGSNRSRELHSAHSDLCQAGVQRLLLYWRLACPLRSPEVFGLFLGVSVPAVLVGTMVYHQSPQALDLGAPSPKGSQGLARTHSGVY